MAEKQWSEMTQEEKWQSFDRRMDLLEKRISEHQSCIEGMNEVLKMQYENLKLLKERTELKEKSGVDAPLN